ncbi:MAG: biotin/lipoyl-containing protein [Pyrinomonadaceae bacterium]
MKLQAELENEKREINFRQDESQLIAEIDGRHYELEADEVEANVYLLKHENKIYQVFVSPGQNSSEPLNVRVGTNNFEIKLSDPKRLRSSAGIAGATDGAAEIKTAMPGKVVRILTEKGAEIKQGEGVIIVEAMKMQNEMKSPKDGIVKEIRVAEGETVNAGDILAVIE